MTVVSRSAVRHATVDAVVEIASGSERKFEYDPISGRLSFERFLPEPMPRGVNYGRIPQTVSGDGEDLDVFVLSSRKIRVGDGVTATVMGVVYVRDEGGRDSKIMSIDAEDPALRSLSEIPIGTRDDLIGYYLRSKNRPGLWAEILGFGGISDAIREVELSKAKFAESLSISKRD